MPLSINQEWSIDFLHYKLQDGKFIRMFNVIDGFNSEALGIKVYFSLPTEQLVLSLDQIIVWRGNPCVIRSNNGPELVSGRLLECEEQHQIFIQYIQLGKPRYKVHLERFNRIVRYEWLSQYSSESINEFQEFATQLIYKYNSQGSSMALGGITLK